VAARSGKGVRPGGLHQTASVTSIKDKPVFPSDLL
jgi:hypothetical protein